MDAIRFWWFVRTWREDIRERRRAGVWEVGGRGWTTGTETVDPTKRTNLVVVRDALGHDGRDLELALHLGGCAWVV
jgi:hypothetical protein